MRLGIFGGTFSPFHNGHYDALCRYIKTAKLDRTVVIPTGIPPHKQIDGGASDEDRWQMTVMAVGDVAEVCDYEMKKSGKSYTIETLEYFHNLYPDAELFLFVGSDMLLCFDKIWTRFEDILKLSTLVAFSRMGDDFEELDRFAEHLRRDYGGRVIVSREQPFVVSSSQIRDLLQADKSVEGLMNPKVEEYIRTHGLYGVKK